MRDIPHGRVHGMWTVCSVHHPVPWKLHANSLEVHGCSQDISPLHSFPSLLYKCPKLAFLNATDMYVTVAGLLLARALLLLNKNA